MSTKRPRRRLRIVAGVLFALALLIALAPTILSAGIARSFVLPRLAAALGDGSDVEGVELGWFSGVTVRQLRGGAFLKLKEARVQGSLWNLVWGADPLPVVIDGLHVTVEELAGGRTNLDSLLQRLQPAPAEPPPEKRAVRPFRIQIENSSVTLRRLPRTPQTPPTNPFEEDARILPADAHAQVFALDSVSLSLEMSEKSAKAAFSGRLLQNGQGGTVRGKAHWENGALEAEVESEAMDIGSLGFPIAGVVGLNARITHDSQSSRIALISHATDFAAYGRSEERIDLSLEATWTEATRTGESIEVARLALTTASGEIALSGEGSLPGKMSVRGHLPAELLAQAMGRPPRAGRIEFDVTGGGEGKTYVVAGSMGLRGFEPADLTSRFDLTIAPAEQAVTIRLLEVTAPEVSLQASGSARGGESPVADLAFSADADLARLRDYLSTVLPIDEEMVLSGMAHVREARLLLDEEGNVELRARGEIDHFVYDEVAREKVTLGVDVLYEKVEDRLLVREGLLDALRLEGSAEGLIEGRLRRADVTISGEIDLYPALARLAGLEALEGKLSIEGKSSTSPTEGVIFGGTVTARSFRVRRGDLDLAQRTLTLAGKGSWAEGVLRASGEIAGDAFRAEIKSAVTGALPTSARGSIELTEIADLVALLPEGTMPAEISAGGDLAGPFAVRLFDDRTEFEAALASKALTVRTPDATLTKEPLRLRLAGTLRGADIELADSSLALSARDLLLPIHRVTFSQGVLKADVGLKGPLARLAPLHPSLQKLGISGLADLRMQVTHDTSLSFGVGGSVQGLRTTAMKGSGNLTIEGKGRREARDWQLDALLLTLDGTKVEATGRVGESTDLKLHVSGDFTRLGDLLPGGSAEGPLDVQMTITGSLGGGSPLHGRGSFSCRNLRLHEIALTAPSGELAVEALLTAEGLRDLGATALVRASTATIGSVSVRGAEVSYTGATTEDGAFEFRTRVTAKTLLADAVPFERIDLSVTGALTSLDAKALEALVLTGRVTFESASTKTVDLTGGSALIEMRGGVAYLRDLQMKASGGLIGGEAEVVYSKPTLDWKAKLDVRDFKLSTVQDRALSFAIPFLRLGKALKEGAVLEGTLAAELDISGKGADGASIARSLGGRGALRFKGVAVRGSILLPLLNLRIDQLLSREPFRFEDLEVSFAVKGGRVLTAPYELKGHPFSLHVDGSVGLDGSLDFLLRPSLLPFPLRVSGDLDRPKVRPAPFAGFK